MASDLWTLKNPVFALYTLCSAILLFKTLFMGIYTGLKRTVHKSYSWSEDLAMAGIKETKPEHPSVTRVRRCHQNDLENNIAFAIIALLYTLTEPSLLAAKVLFGGFTVLRLAHTFIFLNTIPQPARFLTFVFGLIINFFMLTSVMIHVVPLCLATL